MYSSPMEESNWAILKQILYCHALNHHNISFLQSLIIWHVVNSKTLGCSFQKEMIKLRQDTMYLITTSVHLCHPTHMGQVVNYPPISMFIVSLIYPFYYVIIWPDLYIQLICHWGPHSWCSKVHLWLISIRATHMSYKPTLLICMDFCSNI